MNNYDFEFTPVDSEEKNDFQFTPIEEEKTSSGIDRRASRYTSRAIESLAGLPGDIAQSVRALASSFGGITPEEKLNPVQKFGRSLLESLPGSQELRAKSAENLPKLEPRTDLEEIEDEIVGDFATLALPIGGKIPFTRALGMSIAGNIGKEAAKGLGLGEGAQIATKLGLMTFTGMFGKGRGINTHINNLYREAENFIPEGASIKYNTDALKKVENMMKKGVITSAEKPVLDYIKEFEQKIIKGKVPVEEAIEFDKRINREIMRSYNDKSLRGNLKQLKKGNMSSLDEYAKENPSWGDTWKEAKLAYKGIETSQNAKNYIKRNANIKNLTYGAALLGMSEAFLPGSTLMKLGSLGATGSALYASAVAKRLATNPALRKYYANVLTASVNENKAMLLRNLQGLERTAKKEFEDNPLDFDFEEIFK